MLSRHAKARSGLRHGAAGAKRAVAAPLRVPRTGGKRHQQQQRRPNALPVPGLEGVEIPVDVDVAQLQDTVSGLTDTVAGLGSQAIDLIPQEAKDYVSTIDADLIKGEVDEGLGVVKSLAGDAAGQLNSQVIQPYWKEAAPQLEAYFREAWGDYYYDYFIDEWNSGVNDLNRLYNWLDTVVVAGDWRRLLALVVGTWYSPGILSGLLSLNKGYKGNLDALDALQLVEKTAGSLVDVRTENEKENSGQPDLPRQFRNCYLDVGYARDWLTPDVLKLSKDKSVLECKATSTVIADLRRINGNKRQPVIVLDSSDDGRAKMIAKTLTSEHGFKKVFIVNGGFSSWKQNKLPFVPPQNGRGTRRTLFF